jgi:lipoprotein-releasing system permease protein
VSSYELWLALRYTQARKGFVSFISFVSMAGIALGVAALIVVMSVMNGFQKELKDRILGVVSHLEITGSYGRVYHWEDLAKKVEKDKDVVATAPYIFAQGMLIKGNFSQGIAIRGILPAAEKNISSLGQHIKSGSLYALQPHQYGLLIGTDLARTLGLNVGDTVMLVAPRAQASLLGVVPRMRRFTIVGIFEMGMYEYDSALAFAHLEDIQRLYEFDGAISGIRTLLTHIDLAPVVAQRLRASLGDVYVTDWTQQNANFFAAIQMEKRVMFIILFLIVAVAAFNLVSTLVMTVTEKTGDIAILRTIGAAPRNILAIFIMQGALVGIIGLIVGVVGGVVLAENVGVIVPAIEKAFGMHFLPKSVYNIDELPSLLLWTDVSRVAWFTFFLSLLATIYPALRAAKTAPAEALRNE